MGIESHFGDNKMRANGDSCAPQTSSNLAHLIHTLNGFRAIKERYRHHNGDSLTVLFELYELP